MDGWLDCLVGLFVGISFYLFLVIKGNPIISFNITFLLLLFTIAWVVCGQFFFSFSFCCLFFFLIFNCMYACEWTNAKWKRTLFVCIVFNLFNTGSLQKKRKKRIFIVAAGCMQKGLVYIFSIASSGVRAYVFLVHLITNIWMCFYRMCKCVRV